MPAQPPQPRSGVIAVLASAALFGAATPVAKALLAGMAPLILAGLFYLGSGLALSAWAAARNFLRGRQPGAGIPRGDLGWLGVTVFFGGVAGPVLLFTGLASTPASTTALLLTLEGALTALLARALFREHLGVRLIWGMAAIVAGCALLGWQGAPSLGGSWLGPAAVAGACLAWAIDNNVTRRISGGDAVTIGAVKGVVAGAINLALGLSTGAPLPGWLPMAAALLVGVAGYGQSLVLFVRALRDLGTARTAAYFSIAPFSGALLSILFLGEPLTVALVAGGVLVGAGVWLHLAEDHVHEHEHFGPAHSHWHGHDSHHDHELGAEGHQHPHEHPLTVHSHPHYPDIHHRHGH